MGRYAHARVDADTSGTQREEGVPVRQWELFGITDSDPYWTPPKRPSTDDTIAIVPDVDTEEEATLIPEPAA